MRVLHIVPNIDPKQGGPARSVVALVQALRKVEGLQVELAAAGPMELVDIPFTIRTRWSLPSGTAKKKLREAIAQANVVQLHSFWNGIISYAAKTCRQLKIPYIHTPRGMLDPFCLRTRSWLKKLSAWFGEEKNIAGAAGFHLLSQEEEQGMLSARPYLQNRDRVIAPNGLGQVPEQITEGLLAQRFPETKGRQTLLFLGRLDEIKGLELPLQSLAMIPAEKRPMVLLIGPDFGVQESLQQQAATLGVAPWVIFTGPIYADDRFSLLAQADVIGLTSHYDCNPVTATEAFAVGGVVLATEGSGLRHAAQQGAAVVVPRTVAAFAEALQDLLADEPRRSMLSKSARLYANRQLRWDRLIEPLLQMYQRIRKTPEHHIE
jgi:glycosyltransferase involved in cell wall biosynthesis